MIFHFSKHKKRILSAALCGSLMLSVGAPVLAFDENTITSSIFAEEQMEEAVLMSENPVSLAESGYILQRLGCLLYTSPSPRDS